MAAEESGDERQIARFNKRLGETRALRKERGLPDLDVHQEKPKPVFGEERDPRGRQDWKAALDEVRLEGEEEKVPWQELLKDHIEGETVVQNEALRTNFGRFLKDTYGVDSVNELRGYLTRSTGEGGLEMTKSEVEESLKGLPETFEGWLEVANIGNPLTAVPETVASAKDVEDRSENKGENSADLVKLRELWASEETVILYVVGESKDQDHLLFVDRKGKLPTASLSATALEKFFPADRREAFASLPRPYHSKERSDYWRLVRALSLTGVPLGAKEFRLVYPISLNLNEKSLERYVEPKLQETFRGLNEVWTKRPESITNIGVLIEREEFTKMKVRTREGDDFTFPFTVFTRVFDGVETVSRRKKDKILKGARFDKLELLPVAGIKARDILRSIKIGGQALSVGVNVYVGPPVVKSK